MRELSVIVVSWNVRELLRVCLQTTLAETAEIDAEVIVVDNASRDGSAEMVRAEFPEVRLIANQHNAGFSAGNNQGLEAAGGRYLLFLNPDTEVRPGAIRHLLAFIDQRPQVGCVGPKLLNPDGSVQPSRRGFPRLATAFVESTVLQRWLGGLPALRDFYRESASPDEPQPVDWIVGACMLFRREALDRTGGFDEQFFMYSEEMELCWRTRHAGYEIWYVPEAEIVHHEGASSRQDTFRRNANFHDSRYRFFRKYYGAGPALALRWFVFGTFLFQLAEEAGKFVLQPAKRAMRRERIHLYTKIVQWYLSAS
ncbi:MAG TPA: glycosyltransferase family 2 protein [Chloroflexota bacterium]|nr:glycosyltransferase family 2 protein [Chloroflexota bacterium]